MSLQKTREGDPWKRNEKGQILSLKSCPHGSLILATFYLFGWFGILSEGGIPSKEPVRGAAKGTRPVRGAAYFSYPFEASIPSA